MLLRVILARLHRELDALNKDRRAYGLPAEIREWKAEHEQLVRYEGQVDDDE